jgi:hypothetical protein
MPERIQMRRTKGWRKPEGAIVVARPSRWGNPFVVGDGYLTFHGYEQGEVGRYGMAKGGWAEMEIPDSGLTAAMAVALYRACLEASIDEAEAAHHPSDRAAASEIVEALEALRGHDLACWCPLDQPCHADVLLELANR